MTKHTGWPVARDAGGNGTTAKGARLASGGLVAATAAILGVRRGVFVDNMAPVVSGTGGMAYEVRQFRGVTMTTTSNGPVLVAIDSPETVSTSAAPGSNSRIDVIWVRQHLVSGDGGSDSDVELEIGVTQGSVGAAPSVPSIPSGALALARATVTAGATQTSGLTIERAHDWTVANGGLIPDGNGGALWFNGTAWVSAPVGDTGWQALPISTGYQVQDSDTFGPVGVRRIGPTVSLRGVISKVSGTFPASAETIIATISDGAFRPPFAKDFQATGHTAATDSKIRVKPNGQVSIITGSAVPQYITLGDVRFLVD